MAKTKKSAKKQTPRKTPRSPRGLADPTHLQPFTGDADDSLTSKPGAEVVQVIIETPKGCHNKYSFDQKQKLFVLKKALPSGMVFPYDFGFVPQTEADDGDPVDVLVLMDEPAYPGIGLMGRLIGVIEGEQLESGEAPVRNDRLVAVAQTSHIYANFNRLKDMPKRELKEIEEFFVNYHQLEGKEYKLLGMRGRKTALALIEKSRKRG